MENENNSLENEHGALENEKTKMEKEKSILEYLFFKNKPIRARHLADDLHFKHSTLNSVLKRMERLELVHWDKYGEIHLTHDGRKKAAHLSNHHFIVEKFLIKMLDVDPPVAHAEALLLSPHISCTVIEAICRKLGVSHTSINSHFCSERTYSS